MRRSNNWLSCCTAAQGCWPSTGLPSTGNALITPIGGLRV